MSEQEREARIQDALNDIFAYDSSDDRCVPAPMSAEKQAEIGRAAVENAQRVAEQRAWAAQEAFGNGGPVPAPVVGTIPVSQPVVTAPAANPLPALTGSPKQVAWAETIRTTFNTVYTNILAPLSLTDEQRVIFARLRNRTLNMNTAGWWIDHRHELEGRLAVECAISSAIQSKHESNRKLAHDALKALHAAK